VPGSISCQCKKIILDTQTHHLTYLAIMTPEMARVHADSRGKAGVLHPAGEEGAQVASRWPHAGVQSEPLNGIPHPKGERNESVANGRHPKGERNESVANVRHRKGVGRAPLANIPHPEGGITHVTTTGGNAICHALRHPFAH